METERASSTPLTSSEPIALTHDPFFTSSAVTVVVAWYVVDAVVFTVVVLELAATTDLIVIVESVIDVMVPKAPPNPPRNADEPPPPNPPGGKPDGVGCGAPPSPNPPAGGVKPPCGKPLPPPNPPPPGVDCWQPEVLVTEMVCAVIVLGKLGVVPGVGRRLPVPESADDTDTQSPIASDEREVDDVDVKRVSAVKSTVAGPLVSCTAALDALAAMTLPDTDAKDALVELRFPLFDDTDDGDDPPPHAVNARASAAPVAVQLAMREARRRRVGDTGAPLMRRLLGSQCVDWREPGGSRGGVDPEGNAEDDGDDDRPGRSNG